MSTPRLLFFLLCFAATLNRATAALLVTFAEDSLTDLDVTVTGSALGDAPFWISPSGIWSNHRFDGPDSSGGGNYTISLNMFWHHGTVILDGVDPFVNFHADLIAPPGGFTGDFGQDGFIDTGDMPLEFRHNRFFNDWQGYLNPAGFSGKIAYNANNTYSYHIVYHAVASPNVIRQSAIVVDAGATGNVSSLPTSGDGGGVFVELLGGFAGPILIIAANYSSSPVEAPLTAPGGFTDVRITPATDTGSASASFFYPSSLDAAAEAILKLAYFNGLNWALVRSAGDADPILDTSNDLDGTVSGGRFRVVFDSSSIPAITELTGTVFALTAAFTPPEQCTIEKAENISRCNDTGKCGAVVDYAKPLIHGDCAGLTLVCQPDSGSFFRVGTTTVTCTLTDGTGALLDTSSFDITIADCEPPQVLCPGNIVREVDPGSLGVVVTFNPLAFDNCGATVTCVPASGSVFPIGLSTVQCTATDGNGATAVCNFTVTVTVPVVPVGKCPLPQGAWKTHPTAWPVRSLLLGQQTYSVAELLALLKSSTTGDASLILSRQLIAALLNIQNGSDPAPIAATIGQAQISLSGFSGKLPYQTPSSSAPAKVLIGFATQLELYNTGILTPKCSP
jgi:hypothetical protein